MSLAIVASDKGDESVGEALLGPDTWAEEVFWPAVRKAGILEWGAGFEVTRENAQAFAKDWETLRPVFVKWRPEAFNQVADWTKDLGEGSLGSLMII